MCASGLQCVPDAHRCDRALQCHDGSDEVKCRYVRNKGIILFSNYIDISLKNLIVAIVFKKRILFFAGAIVKTSLTRLSFILILFFIFVIK